MNRMLLAILLTVGACAAKSAPAPIEAAPPPVDPEAWRATPPKAGPEGPWVPPVAGVFTLANGIPVYFVPNPALPLVSVRLMVEVGREANPPKKGGLAALTANLLDEGTRTRTAAQIASDAASAGAELTVFQGEEYATVALDALAGEPLAAGIELLADVALNPRFDAGDFARTRAETLTTIQGAKAEPRDAAARTFAAQLFGADHPYGVPSIGSDASVRALKVADVKAFHKTWWHAGNAAFIVSGAVDDATLKTLLDAKFGSWKAGKTTRAPVAASSLPLKTRVVFVEQPGAVQSVLRVGTLGPRRTAPEYMGANVAGTLVGGMFSSRININLREEHGWSYGAYAGFSESRDFGQFVVRTQVQADKTAPAITEILKELEGARATVPTDDQLRLAKDSLLKSIAGNFETNAATAGAFQYVPAFDLKPDFWKDWIRELEAIDGGASAAAAQRYFGSSQMLVVVVGPRTVELPDAQGVKQTVDVVGELKALGFEYVEPG